MSGPEPRLGVATMKKVRLSCSAVALAASLTATSYAQTTTEQNVSAQSVPMPNDPTSAVVAGSPQGTTPALSPTDNALGDIVVTATKQGAVSLQRVGESIQVFTQENLQKQQIESFNDYYRQVPGLSAINQGPGQSQIVLRGITTGRFSYSQPQLNSTSGLYIDEIPVSSGAFNPDLQLFDVQRIEVLKGPQGTLYGAGAMSGAIRILTNSPKLGQLEGTAESTLSDTEHGGFNYAERGVINVPIGDMIALRVSGYYQYNDGYIDNIYHGQQNFFNPGINGFYSRGTSTITNQSYNSNNNYNYNRTYGGRASLMISPGGGFDLNLNVIYQNLHSGGRPDEYVKGDPITNSLNAPGESTTITGPYQVNKFLEDPLDDRFVIFNGVINYDLKFAKLTSSTSYFLRQDNNTLDDTYRNRFQQGTLQADGTSAIFTPFYNNNRTLQFSNETRLASAGGGLFQWVVGGFYSEHIDRFLQSAPEVGLDALLLSFGLPPSSGFGADPNDVAQGTRHIKQTQYAGFGEVTLNVTDRLSFLGGLRAYHFKQDVDIRYAGVSQGVLSTEQNSTRGEGVTPKVQVNYKATSDVLIYAQAAKGFRLGGVNEPVPLTSVFGVTSCGADLAARGIASVPNNYGSDSLWNYELGFKGQTRDHRVTLNVSAYQIDWKNIQTNVYLPCGFETIVNAGKARNRGVEAEFRISPVTNLVLGVSGSFTDARLLETGLAFNAQPGDRLPNVPRWLVNGSLDYDYPLSGDRSVYLRANVTYQGDSYSDFQSSSDAVKVPASTSEDIFLGYRFSKYELSIFVKNLSDERIVTGVNTDRLTPVTYSVSPPRTVGITARAHF